MSIREKTLSSWAGGDSLISPDRTDDTKDSMGGRREGGYISQASQTTDKYIRIIEYLKTLNRDVRATHVDISRSLNINLEEDSYVLDMMKSNPKISKKISVDDVLSFQYRAKFEIRDEAELLLTIQRERNGLVFKDIEDCYPDILYDCQRLIMGGDDVIACSNKALKTFVLYPRGYKYLTKLSGDVIAEPGNQMVITSTSLCNEIRRGEAIKIASSWFRVSSSEKAGSGGVEPQRASAPHSVTSNKELSSKNVYYYEFKDKNIPLDGDFADDNKYTGPAYRHGVTNDLRDAWKETLSDFRKNVTSPEALQHELIKNGLITKPGTLASRRKGGEFKKRVKRTERKVKMSTSSQNSHLTGTSLDRLANEIALRDKIKNK